MFGNTHGRRKRRSKSSRKSIGVFSLAASSTILVMVFGGRRT